MKFKISDLFVSPLTASQERLPHWGFTHDIYIGSLKIAEITNRKPYSMCLDKVWRIVGEDQSTFKDKEAALAGLVRRLNGETNRW